MKQNNNFFLVPVSLNENFRKEKRDPVWQDQKT